MARPTLRRAAAALAASSLVLLPALSHGGEARNDELMRLLKQMNERLEKLEKRNAELERQLKDRNPAPIEKRVRALEDASTRIEKALETDRISEKEPELATRLKAVEFQTLNMQKQARQIEALEGITVSASLTGVVQGVSAAGSDTGGAQSRANYRGDVAVTLPGGTMGNSSGKIFAHLRLGQGNGIGLRPTYTSTPNTTTFQVQSFNQNPDDSHGVLAQAWYQLTMPLPLDALPERTREHLHFTFGKIDPFLFFDQNAAADDETSRFINNAFVHNPLLDSGADIGADRYGFSPGAILAYANEKAKPESWGVSLGVFGSGPASNFSGSLGQPFVIGQLETNRRLFGGLPGNYRAYLWRNGRANDFDGPLARHSGVGFSVDQRVGDGLTVFARYGHQLKGKVRFDRALTLGTEVGGSYWGRAADSVGFAAGLLRTSRAFRNGSATVDADGDGTPDWGYGASGSERIAELYYRFRINSRFDITPDFQLVQRPGGNGAAPTVRILGLRAKVGF